MGINMLSHWDGMGWDRVCCDCSVLLLAGC